MKSKTASFKEISKHKLSTITIKNDNGSYLLRVLVTGIALADEHTSRQHEIQYNNLRDKRPAQKGAALKSSRRSGVNIATIGEGYEALAQFQTFLTEYNITSFLTILSIRWKNI